MPHTHIIIHQRSQDGAVLYRASDGMVLAARQGTIVNFGVDPKETKQRHFMDKSFAAAFLRNLADSDASGLGVDLIGTAHDCGGMQVAASIEDREGDKRIISPADVVGSGLSRN